MSGVGGKMEVTEEKGVAVLGIWMRLGGCEVPSGDVTSGGRVLTGGLFSLLGR